MIFCGDIALPYLDAIQIEGLPNELKKSRWIGNLEGTLLNHFDCETQIKGVYNNFDALKGILSEIPFKAFVLANNHLFDAGSYVDTAKKIENLGLQHVGAGCNIEEASNSIDIVDTDGTSYRILAFGWDCIECEYATNRKQGVNPYIKKHVLHNVQEVLSNNNRLICFFHWNYELELYPQPYDRQLAHELIDAGVYAVIGCHAHRTQQIEIYKGHPIVYGLGNFLFKQGYYFDGKLKYPVFCNEEWCFEIKGEEFYIHYFDANSLENTLVFKYTEQILEDKHTHSRANYEKFTSVEYESFFRNNRVQKKLLPIFQSNESEWSFSTKTYFVKLRGMLLNLIVKANLKSGDRSKRSK